MNLLGVSWKNLWYRPFSTSVSVLLMLLGVAMVSLVLHISNQIEGQFKKNIAGIDMVIGAKGSPKQLILSSVYHIDAPTGNISKSDADKVLKHPMVKTAIPLAYGDSYKGFKIVGTTKDYLDHFEATLAEGNAFEKSLEIVLGAKVAESTGLKIGSYFHGTHGMEEADQEHVHEHYDYKVVGILEPSGMAIDQLLICNVASIWDIHSNEHGEESENEKEYTAVLVKFSNPMGMMMIPRMVNENTKMQAAMPSIEISSLIDQMGLGVETLRLLALLIIIISGISVFLSLLAALKERKYELAIMRSLGAHPIQMVFLVVYEALLIAMISAVLGLFLSRFMLIYLGTYLDKSFHYSFDNIGFLNQEYFLVALALLIGLVAALVPAVMAFRINISKTLSQD